MDKPTPKNKGGRPKKPPTPPVLGVALRQGAGYTVNVILGGLVVNGKKFDPQTGADLIADMLAEWMAKIAAPKAPEPAEVDTAKADSLEWSSHPAEDLPALELATEPGTNGNH